MEALGPFEPEAESEDYEDSEAPADPGSRAWMLVAGASCVALALLALLGGGLALNVFGYLLAAPVAFTLVAFARRAASQRMSLVGIGPSPLADRAPAILLGLGFLVSVVHAYLIADHFA